MTKEQIEQKAMQIADDGIKIIEKFNPKNPPNFYDGAYHGAIEMSRWLLENLWISVEDELPPFEEEVIVYAICDIGPIQFFCHRSNNPNVVTDKYGFCVYNNDKITYWMPIPKLNKK